MSILTLAALLLALTLLSAGAPPASAQVDTAATEVEVFENWSLKPPGADNYSDFYDGTWDSPDPTNGAQRTAP